MGLEDKYLDVLQNIEFAIVSVYRKDNNLSDHDVMGALDALIDYYRAESRGYTPRDSSLAGKVENVFRQAKQICEFWLGRASLGTDVEIPISQITSDKIVSCLRKIRKSVEFWNGEGGRQGYLKYVSQFMP